jgi:carbon-monoxide dehydrogenase large subunit
VNPRIVVVGLGPGDPGLVTASALARIEAVPCRWLRTARHPSSHLVPDAGSFDVLYDTLPTFDEVYSSIVERLVAEADEHGEVLYAVPGSPLVLERTVALLREAEGVDLVVEPAVSFLDEVWRAIGMDPVEVRRRNLIPRFMEPHTTVVGQTYDVGDYETALDKVLVAGDYAGWRTRQAERRAAGGPVQIGIGVSVYVEITGGVGGGENARLEITEDGGAVVYTGTSPHGQGHQTAWAMLASEQTGIPMDRISVVWGDTDTVPEGAGTMGSRSLQQGGNAVFAVAGELVDKARSVAARLLEADDADVVLDKDRGVFHVAGTPAVTRSWADLAVAEKSSGGLSHARNVSVTGPTFPFGAHLAVVEVDTDTGKVRHIAHVACDDAGTVLNPLILEGQIHGGVAQGAAQALLEEVLYDPDGNPVTANLADYAFISAAEVPSVTVVHMETPTPNNLLGAKGIGESGTIGATPAVQSAVVDAVTHLGVSHIDMPATPMRVWSAIRAAAGE